MNFAHPEYLISAQELNKKLGNDNLRVFDATISLKPNPKGGYMAVSGGAAYEEAHVPGASFLDHVAQLSDTSNPAPLARLPDEQLVKTFADAGISADSDVVFYSSGMTMWATRAWWLLHYCGHEKVAVLDGGLKAWRDAGFECAAGASNYPPAQWSSTALKHRFVDKDDVVAAMDNAGICIVNALSPGVYAGTDAHHYGRPGHIPNSVNVYYNSLLDDEKFRSPEEVVQTLTDGGLLSDRPVIAYCGGGISATIDALACLMAGKEDVAVYDGSMNEWARDKTLPLVEGSEP